MFTGIVEELGEVVGLADGRLRVAAATVLADATIGASIAVNGCCLTVVHLDVPAVGQPGIWEADLSGETLACSLWLDASGAPVYAEIAENDKIIAAAEFTNFIFGDILSPDAAQ